MSKAQLHLRRISQAASYFRKFRVILDGECIDKIKRGASRVYEITPGEHELVMKIDWVSSEPVVFRCEAGQSVRFVCGHPSPTWHAALAPHLFVSAILLVPDDGNG